MGTDWDYLWKISSPVFIGIYANKSSNAPPKKTSPHINQVKDHNVIFSPSSKSGA
jgi:hypothetical protein